MSELSSGMLVQHNSLGVGKVVAVEATAVHVFFPGSETRYAAKLRWPAVQPMLRTDGVAADAWLEGLSSFKLDAASGRYALAASFVTEEQALEAFLETYPQGFRDPAYVGSGAGKRERASRWRAAHAEWGEAFARGEGERLLGEGDFRELARRALRIEKHVTLVPGTFEPGDLEGALEDDETARPFFTALVGLLSVPSPARARFEALFAATAKLPAPAALLWPIATVFPFVADPTRHVFLWPKTACAGAERLGCDLRYDAAPSWATYAALRKLSVHLLEKLAPVGGEDHVDVESFLYATAARRAPPADAAAAQRATPARRTTTTRKTR